ncbi:hypothetical protein ABIE27_003136 [Paenibacillus sp. 4624]|uniref:hypothetical protein n=1 Tax=Paenibacillus sp. 4624 TaxID=3156453 RepID=UPI003D1EA3F4
MNKILKNWAQCSLSIVLSVSLFTPVSSAASTQVQGNEVLLNSGWSQKEINDLLSEDEIQKYASGEISDTTTHFVKQTIKVKVDQSSKAMSTLQSTPEPTLTPVEGSEERVLLSEEEFYQEMKEYEKAEGNPQAILKLGKKQNSPTSLRAANAEVDYVIPDGYMKYTMQAFKTGSKDYQLNLRFEWLKMPVNRGIDVFALGHGPGLVQTGTQDDLVFTGKYNYVTAGQPIKEANITPISKKTDSGGSFVTFRLDQSSLAYSLAAYRGYLSYHTSVSNSTELTTSVEGYYKHKVSKLTVSPSVSYPLSVGLSISSESSYVTESPTPYFSLKL